LEKLKDYRDRLENIPAYIVSMGVLIFLLEPIFLLLNIFIALDPQLKLNFYREESPGKFDWAKKMFLRIVSYLSHKYSSS
jgi:hypothetical protein